MNPVPPPFQLKNLFYSSSTHPPIRASTQYVLSPFSVPDNMQSIEKISKIGSPTPQLLTGKWES